MSDRRDSLRRIYLMLAEDKPLSEVSQALIEEIAHDATASAHEPEVRQVAYLVENSGGITRAIRYRCMRSGVVDWTYDANAALWFCRRSDADEFAAEDPADVRIVEHVFVTRPTKGGE
jgi:hypothetical protein